MDNLSSAEVILNLGGIILEVLGFGLLLPRVLKWVRKNEPIFVQYFPELYALVKNSVNKKSQESIDDIIKECGFETKEESRGLVYNKDDERYKIGEKFYEFHDKWYGKVTPITNGQFKEEVQELARWLDEFKIENKKRLKSKVVEAIGIPLVMTGLFFQGLAIIFHS